jgi:hypothetical protein
MIKRIAILVLAAGWLAPLCVDASAQARKRVPRFEDYPVKEIYQGKIAPLVLETREQQDSKTYYQAIADGGVNFAGHYAVVPLTCGPNCIAADYIDLRTGKITSGDFDNSGFGERHDAFREMEFRRGSRLIVFAGQIDRKGPNGWHFYVFNDGKMKRIHTIVTNGDFRKPLTEWMK